MDLSSQLSSVAQAMGCRYTLNGAPVTYEYVFSPTGLLPGILRRADQLCSFCLGYGLGVTFERSENAALGVVAQLDATTPTILRLLCVTDVLYELMQQSPAQDLIPLDDLMTD